MMSGHGPNQSPIRRRSPQHWVAYRRGSVSSEYDSSDCFDQDLPVFSPSQSPQFLPTPPYTDSILSNDRDSRLRRYRHSSGSLREESLQRQHGQQHRCSEQTRSQENLLRQEMVGFPPVWLDDPPRLRRRRNAVHEKINRETFDLDMAKMQDSMTRLEIDTPPEDIAQESDTSMDTHPGPAPDADCKRKRDILDDEQSPCDEICKRARRSFSCPSKKEGDRKKSGAAPDSSKKRGMDDDRQPRSKRARGRSASPNLFQEPKRKRDNEQDEEVFSPKRARFGKTRGKGHTAQ